MFNALKSMPDVDLLSALVEANRLVRYYESSEGEWSREGEDRRAARLQFNALLDEAFQRNLDFQECLQ